MNRGGQGCVVMTSPAHYEVCYAINPWMEPQTWSQDPGAARAQAGRQWSRLAAMLREAGLTVKTARGEPGLPDMVFPANAAIVLDGRVLLSRFRHPQRQGEEAKFRRFFHELAVSGAVCEVGELSPGVIQEGAGDCVWDASRGVFWAGYGPRSEARSLSEIADYFGVMVLGLELATARYYHLDTCFCVLPGGEVLYYPGAFTPQARRLIESVVPADQRIAATAEEARSFSLNAVAAGRDLIMTPPPDRLRRILEERGYRCRAVNLSSFVMSGGGAYCMTLRLDLTSAPRSRPVNKGEITCSPKDLTTLRNRAARC
jgi:N-dimethylarginine dimethylaminohydrolase